VSAALDQLDESEREIVMLASRAGLSLGEIGNRLGLGIEEVHQLLRRGLDRVRGSLEHTLRREPM
jgi:RNA polymerase sigma factor (sigma-70 family)